MQGARDLGLPSGPEPYPPLRQRQPLKPSTARQQHVMCPCSPTCRVHSYLPPLPLSPEPCLFPGRPTCVDSDSYSFSGAVPDSSRSEKTSSHDWECLPVLRDSRNLGGAGASS